MKTFPKLVMTEFYILRAIIMFRYSDRKEGLVCGESSMEI